MYNYWCGYGSDPAPGVLELIKAARDNSREAHYIATDGFDKTLIHLAKSCFETDDEKKLRINEILNTVSDDSLTIAPFTLDARPWATVKEITRGLDIAAVPFKKKVFAVSTKSLINQAFTGRLRSDIVRVPISKTDIQKISAFKELMLGSILRAISAGKHKLWQIAPDSKTTINDQEISVHKAVELSLFFDTRFAYVSLKPAIYLNAVAEISKEARQKHFGSVDHLHGCCIHMNIF